MHRKKLVEVALPLNIINSESDSDKKRTHYHPSTVHFWWARRPLAACRAMIFASLVDDPSSWPELFPDEQSQEKERRRLFSILEELIQWKNTYNETVLLKAQREIATSIARNRGEEIPEDPENIKRYISKHAPALVDPFCGRGVIPLEAQRLGLKAYASDLNPVAVLITKALIEIPPKFAGIPPVNPEAREKKALIEKEWRGAEGLAEDVRYYGRWMRDEAKTRIGHLYPRVKVTEEMANDRPDLKPYVGQELTVIAWLWARTVPSPNPVLRGTPVPLARSFWLSKNKGKEAYVYPVIAKENGAYRFEVRVGRPEGFDPSKGTIIQKKGGRCLISGDPISFDYLREQGKAGRMGARLMAIVAEGSRGRVYLSPDEEHENIASQANPNWKPEYDLPNNPRDFKTPNYGMKTFASLFTNRQLVALTTFCDLVKEAREKVLEDAKAAGSLPDDDRPLDSGGTGPIAYSDIISTYLSFGISKMLDYHSSLTTWHISKNLIRNTFNRQALWMTWDFAEANPFSSSTGSWDNLLEWIPKFLSAWNGKTEGFARQLDAVQYIYEVEEPIVFTDPPYYDNIGYADLSDYFYIWLRRSLGDIYPTLFSTVLTPKAQELIASPYRHEGSTERARDFFEQGLKQAFSRIKERQNKEYPFLVYYAFKQTEEQGEDLSGSYTEVVSTGWETMLKSLIDAGFAITGTWPVVSENEERTVASESNALKSSVVLVCRPRDGSAPLATRKEFISALKAELPNALRKLQHGNIAPVDLAQAAIGPGMAVFTRYSKVLEADGSPMSVRTALALINQTLDEVLAEQEGEFDADTRWAVAWFEQFGMEEGPFGDAETLSKAKNTSVQGLVEAGILEAKGGKVRLLRREELPADWDPTSDRRFTVWEAAQYLIRALNERGESGAAELLRKLGGVGESARDLAYRLYTICDRKRWSQEALAYNSLVTSWPEIAKLAQAIPERVAIQEEMRESE